MRLVVIVCALSTVAIASAVHASEGPWCARFWGGDDYYERCSMRNFDMCLNEIRGTGGNTMCSPNPRYRPAEKAAGRHNLRVRRSF
jgi:hypothetical protein